MSFPIVDTGLPFVGVTADSFISEISQAVTPGAFYIVLDNTNDFILKRYVNQALEFTGTQLNYYFLTDGQQVEVAGEAFSYSPANGWIGTNSYNSGSGGANSSLTQIQVQSAIESALTASEPIAVDTGGVSGFAVSSVTGTANGTNSTIPANSTAISTEIQNKSLVDFLYVKIDGSATLPSSFTLIPLESKFLTGVRAKQALSVITDGNNVDYYVEYVN